MDNLAGIWHAVVLFAEQRGLTAILSLALLNAALGAALAMRDGFFSWQRLGDIFYKMAPSVIVYVAVTFFLANSELQVVILAAILTSFTASVTSQVGRMFPEIGVMLPDSLKF